MKKMLFFGMLLFIGVFIFVTCNAQQGARGSSKSGDGGTPDSALKDSGAADTGSEQDSGFDAGNVPKDNGCPGEVQSFIWISNTAEGTLSKVCTINGKEVARYYTSKQESQGDPSRTSVNLHGDMVVTNRDPSFGPSSVTKFAGDIKDCLDRNSNGRIDTSFGPTEVLPWGEDECMLWNTELPGLASIGARATAWDGEEDPKTGEGGHVWIGALTTFTVFKMDGDTGEILDQAYTPATVAPYGGAVDGAGSFWIVGGGCTVSSMVGQCAIARVDMATMTSVPYIVPYGYGISVDSKGRIWTNGLSGVSRLDPASGEIKKLPLLGFGRGVAVDGNGSVWAVMTSGELVRVDEETVQMIKRFPVGPSEMVGVAVDYEGFIWAVSQGGNAAFKVDPQSYDILEVPIGMGPYTYSDMTGMQLRQVVPVQ